MGEDIARKGAAAAKVICWHSINTSASNSWVKPDSLPAHGGSSRGAQGESFRDRSSPGTFTRMDPAPSRALF